MKLSTRILLAFTAIILLSVADSYTNYRLSLKVRENSRYLSKSEEIIRNSNRAHKMIIQMQSAFRGFLLSDDTNFLESYYTGMKDVPGILSSQRKLVSKNEMQAALLDSISILHGRWTEYSKSLIDSRIKMPESQQSYEKYIGLFNNRFKNHVGKSINDAITEKFLGFDRIEYKIRNEYSETLTKSIHRTGAMSIIFLALTIIVGVLSTYYIVTLISKRIASMVGLADNISKGNFSIVNDTKNDELTSLSRSLNVMSDKLNKNIRELEHRNAELNKFAYVVSHDLKAPVRGIHNVIKWIEEDLHEELSPEMKKYLRIIPQRTQRMEALINGLLDYARISKKTDIEEIDINQLVREIADSIVPRNFKFEICDLPVFKAERIKLEQVFLNLISNAVKYTPREDGIIEIGCSESEKYYEFSVKDNGIGIAPEFHDKIFEIFQTLREKYEQESTGVGLAIVRKIIIEQQGSINVRSEPGKGAEFIFTWKKI